MNGNLVRQFMIAAYEMRLTNGDHVFVALDAFRDDVLGADGWKTGT